MARLIPFMGPDSVTAVGMQYSIENDRYELIVRFNDDKGVVKVTALHVPFDVARQITHETPYLPDPQEPR